MDAVEHMIAGDDCCCISGMNALIVFTTPRTLTFMVVTQSVKSLPTIVLLKITAPASQPGSQARRCQSASDAHGSTVSQAAGSKWALQFAHRRRWRSTRSTAGTVHEVHQNSSTQEGGSGRGNGLLEIVGR